MTHASACANIPADTPLARRYHGQGRIKDPKKLAAFDLIVTTYATAASDWTRANKGGAGASAFPLGAIDWFRVVLDESHTIKSPKPAQSQACLALSATRRWCVTGTPMGSEVGDLFGQFLFLGLSPFDQSAYFEANVRRVFGAQGNNYSGSPIPLLYALSRTMIRHTKQQTLGGAAVLALPPKTEEKVGVEFTAEERKAYAAAHKDAVAQFEQYRAQGATAVSQRLLAIMSLLLPLRRIASGGALTDKEVTVPDLHALAAARSAARIAALQNAAGGDDDVKPKLEAGADVKPSFPASGATAAGASGASGAGTSAAAAAADPGPGPVDAKPVLTAVTSAEETCALCGELAEDAVRTGCAHYFCKDCLLGAMPAKASAARCPECKKPVDAAWLMREAAAAAADAAGAASAAGAAGASGAGPATAKAAAKPKPPPAPIVLRCESKLRVLLSELKAMREADETAKALVFSQFNSTLEWLKTRLTEEGFGYRTISGSMPLPKRAAAIEAFQKGACLRCVARSV